MKRINICLTALGIILAMAVAACSSKTNNEVTAVIPADSPIIVAIDAENVITNAGCKYNADGSVEPGEYLKEIFPEELAKFKGIDLRNIFFFVPNVEANNAMAVAPIIDAAALQEILKEFPSEEVDGKNVYTSGYNQSFVVVDNLVWYVQTTPENVFKAIKNTKDAAAKKSLADCSWRMKLLDDTHAAITMVNFEGLPKEAKEQMLASAATMGKASDIIKKITEGSLYINAVFSGNSFTMDYRVYDKDGNAVSMNPAEYGFNVPDINPEFLKYLTPNDLLLFAGTIPAEYPWEEILNNLGKQYNMSAYTQLALPYLQALEGTIAIAAGPKEGVTSFNDGSMSVWDGTLYISLKDKKAEEFFAQINMLAKTQMDQLFTEIDSKTSSIVIPGQGTVYIGVRGNALIASLSPIEAKNDNSVFTAADLKNNKAICLLRIGKDSRIFTDLSVPFGVFSKIFIADDKTGEWYTELTDCNGLMLENIIKLCLKYTGNDCE